MATASGGKPIIAQRLPRYRRGRRGRAADFAGFSGEFSHACAGPRNGPTAAIMTLGPASWTEPRGNPLGHYLNFPPAALRVTHTSRNLPEVKAPCSPKPRSAAMSTRRPALSHPPITPSPVAPHHDASEPLTQQMPLMGAAMSYCAQRRDFRRERAGRLPLQGRQRRGTHLQDPQRRPPPDRRLLSARRHFRP